MDRFIRNGILSVGALLSLITSPCLAQVTEYTSAAQWEQVVSTWTTIGFAEFPDSTLITTQYQPLGVTFSGSMDYTACCSFEFYPQDGAGLYGGFDDLIIMEFDTPQYYFAVDFPGSIQIKLFTQDSLMFEGTIYQLSGAGHFAGVVSTSSFDKVVLDDPNVDIAIDDIRFGVPAPGMLSLLGIATLRRTRARS